MKRLFITIIGIVVLLGGFDISLGLIIKMWTSHHDLPGDNQRVEYMFKKGNEDIIILGSSVAINSLKPSILEDSLDFTVFNGGGNGQKIPYVPCVLDGILKHHHPKFIFWGARVDELTDSSFGRINLLMPYYHVGYSTIDKTLEEYSKGRKFFFNFNLYKYNTILFRILLTYAFPLNELGEKGYIKKPVRDIHPTFQYYKKKVNKINTVYQDKNFICNRYFSQVVETCKKNKIKLFIYIPPVFRQIAPKDSISHGVKLLQNNCLLYKIPFFDYSQDEYFFQHSELFYDNVHLNDNGSNVFTKRFLSDIRNYLN